MRQPVPRLDPATFPEADRRIVDHRIERAQSVDLIGDTTHLRDAGEIPDNDGFRPRHGLHGLLPARVVAGVQHHRMTLLHEQPGGHAPEAVGRSCDKHAHAVDTPLNPVDPRWGR